MAVRVGDGGMMAVMIQKVAMMAEADRTSSTRRTGKRMRYLGVKGVQGVDMHATTQGPV